MKKNAVRLSELLVLGMLILAGYGFFVEPYDIEVHHVWIRDARLAGVLGRRVVVQLSDLHIGEIGRREQKVLKLLDELAPDIIFLTGDYVKWKGEYKGALSFLSRLRAKIGVWAVMGDYDYSRSRESCLFCHEEGSGRPSRCHPVRFLKDNFETINLPEGTLRIGGLDYRSHSISSHENALIPRDMKAPAILLSHSPLVFDLVKNQDILILAGDTHGGQVPLPACLLEGLGYRKNARYNQGFFKDGRKKMFVSRGIGTSHIPIRLFRRPEIVALHFVQ